MLLITVIKKVQGVRTNNVSNFFGKVFNCPNVVASYIPTTVFKRVALELLQYLHVSSSKQLDLLIGCATKDCFYKVAAGQSRHTFSRSYFWVNFWNLSLLILLLYKQQVYSSKVLNVSSSSVTWFPNIVSAARNFGFT